MKLNEGVLNMKSIIQILFTGILLFVSMASSAITISIDELPTALSPINCSTCMVDTTSIIDFQNRSVFYYASYDSASGVTTSEFLIRYNLGSSSNITSVVDESYFGGGDGITTSVTPYSGYLWMTAPMGLDFTGTNQFNIYTDNISSNPDVNNPDDQLSTWSFGMSATDAMSGSASLYFSGNDGYDMPVSNGDLSVLDGIFTCVECGIDVTLNLIGLDYSSGVANPFYVDERGDILQYSDFFDYFDDTRTFSVSAVPVPSAVWLFGSGLLGLIGLARKKVCI